jgi:hypothetical protein
MKKDYSEEKKRRARSSYERSFSEKRAKEKKNSRRRENVRDLLSTRKKIKSLK